MVVLLNAPTSAITSAVTMSVTRAMCSSSCSFELNGTSDAEASRGTTCSRSRPRMRQESASSMPAAQGRNPRWFVALATQRLRRRPCTMRIAAAANLTHRCRSSPSAPAHAKALRPPRRAISIQPMRGARGIEAAGRLVATRVCARCCATRLKGARRCPVCVSCSSRCSRVPRRPRRSQRPPRPSTSTTSRRAFSPSSRPSAPGMRRACRATSLARRCGCSRSRQAARPGATTTPARTST